MNCSPSQSVDVTHTDDFNEDDEEQRQRSRVFVEDGEPVASRAAGETKTQQQTEKTNQTCQRPEENQRHRPD